MASAVLYDDACNFCKVIVDVFLSLDRRRVLRAVAIQSDEGQALLHEVPVDLRLASFHLVDDETGAVLSGGPGLARLVGLIPGGAAFARLLDRLPGPTAATYGWIAAHRVTLSKGVPGALKRRATRRLAAR